MIHVAHRIRLAVPADIEGIVALDRRTHNVPHWAVADYLGAVTSAGGGLEVGGLKTTGTRRCVFVANVAEAIVGFSIGRVTAVGQEVLAELESVGVADSARRAGIGRAMCEAVIAWASDAGASEIELEVRSKSDGAIALYSSLGFAVVGFRPKYYREPDDDAVLMRLSVA